MKFQILDPKYILILLQHRFVGSLIVFTFFLVLLIQSQNLQARTPVVTYSAKSLAFNHNNSQLVYLVTPYDLSKTELITMGINNGKIVKQIPLKFGKKIWPFTATPDGFKLLATSPKGIAVIHNGTGKVLRTLPYPANNIDRETDLFQQSPDGVYLAIPANSQKSRDIHVIHTGSGKLVHSIKLLKNEKWARYPIIQSIGFSTKRNYIAYVFTTLSKESFLRVYDLYKHKDVVSVKLPDTITAQGVIQFSKKGNGLLFSGKNIKQVVLLDIKKQSLKTVATGYYLFVGFTPDDQHLIMLPSDQGRVLIKNIKTGKTRVASSINYQGKNGDYGGGYFNIAISPDRSLLAIPLTTRDFNKVNSFMLINASTGKVFWRSALGMKTP